MMSHNYDDDDGDGDKDAIVTRSPQSLAWCTKDWIESRVLLISMK